MAEMLARDLKPGVTVMLDGKICKVLSSEYSGTGKMIHKTHAIFLTVPGGKQIEKSFHTDDKIHGVDLERKRLAYSYKDGDKIVFTDSKTFEEFSIPATRIEVLLPFLKEDTEVDAEFIEASLLDVVIPESVIVTVDSCAPGLPGIDATTPKSAVVETGLEVLVPQFIKPGEKIRVEVASRKYMERILE